MKVFADLHIHSKYSGATSERMNIHELVAFAEIKGLNLLGTGDALHPQWFLELNNCLESVEEGLYRPKTGQNIYFIPQVEVATIHEYAKKTRRIHHVILMPSLEIAEQLADELKKFGDVSIDGRPILNMHPAELVEIAMALDPRNVVFPAHIWTPWWSIFGAASGVDRMEECYEEEVKHVYAIETGLSSDPPMNWRISWLSKYTILSFSDSHSPYPYRLGREATVFELETLTYGNICEAIRGGSGRNRVELTIEVPPAYGKYHWSGHRKCGVGPLPPIEAKKLGYKCPICGKMLTKGVDDRVEELADMPMGYRPAGARDFVHLLPLQELLALSMGLDAETGLNSRKIAVEYEKLVKRFGSEFKVLLEADVGEIAEESGREIARIISQMREEKIRIIPGYDGIYGRLILGEEEDQREKKYTRLEDYL